MPLPDATPDKRIYELLKTVDLENLTFDNLQAVGQSIFAEQGAEDELRRLVLLNLARLSVVGEWTGLTSAGGGGVGYPNNFWQPNGWTPNAAGYGKFNDNFDQVPHMARITNNSISDYATFYYGAPIQVNVDGSYTTISYGIHTAQASSTLDCGFYTVDDYNRPLTKVGTATLDMSLTAGYHETTITEESTGSMTLSKGDTLWFFFKDTSTGSSASIDAWQSITATQNLGVLDVAGNFLNYNTLIMNSLPSTIAESDIIGVGTQDLPCLGAVIN
jgi:hypothetical protein